MIKSTIKLISIISITFFLVFSFVGQSLVVGAVDTPAPGTGTTATPKPADTTTPKPATPATKSDGPAIGGLKNCTVDKNATLSPKQGNEKLRDCLRDIIQLVITIAVLISVASLAGYGIQLMNPMETSGKIQGQIAQRITELAVGGVILGMFGTILATINPATLTTSKVFGENAVETFRKYIGQGQGITKAGVSTGTGATTGGGTTSGGGTEFQKAFDLVKKPDGSVDTVKLNLPANSATKTQLQTSVNKNEECKDLFATDKDCVGYSPIKATIITELKNAGIQEKYTRPPSLPGPVNTNKKIDDIVDNGNSAYSIIFNGATTATEVKITGPVNSNCKPKPPIEAGKELVPKGCTITWKQ